MGEQFRGGGHHDTVDNVCAQRFQMRGERVGARPPRKARERDADLISSEPEAGRIDQFGPDIKDLALASEDAKEAAHEHAKAPVGQIAQ